jgi:hypothetical protein
VETRNRPTDQKPPQALEQEALAALRAYREQAGHAPWNHDDNESLRALDQHQKQQQAEERAFRDGLDRYQRRGLTPPPAFFDRIAGALPEITEITSCAEETPKAALPGQPEAEETGPLLVRLDPELGRLAVALEKSSEFRVWAVARHVFGNPGWVERGTLFESLQTAHVIHTRRHLNRLLKDGDGLFWNLANGKVYLRGVVKVAQHLTEQAARTNPKLVATNIPGVHDIYVEVAGDIGDFKAIVYAAWLTHREGPTIARETLCGLFGCTDDTLRNWETRLGETLTLVRNYAQTALDPKEDARIMDYLPEHSYSYVTRRGEIRIRWQQPNTYRTTNIRQHPSKGQSRKVRFAAAKAAWYQPVEIWTPGSTIAIEKIPFDRSHRVPKRYFETDEQLRKFLKRLAKKDQRGISPQTPRYVFLGEDPYGHGIWELSLDGWVSTSAQERLSIKAEKQWWKNWETHIAALRKQAQAAA